MRSTKRTWNWWRARQSRRSTPVSLTCWGEQASSSSHNIGQLVLARTHILSASTGKDLRVSRCAHETAKYRHKPGVNEAQFRKERLTFSNQWEALEFQIKKQDDEIDRLKNTQKVFFWLKELLAILLYGHDTSLKKINIECNVFRPLLSLETMQGRHNRNKRWQIIKYEEDLI